jgi:hypothetical protein
MSEGGSSAAAATAERTASSSADGTSISTGVAATQPSATRTPPFMLAAAFAMQVPSAPIVTDAKPSPAWRRGSEIPVSSSPKPTAVR